MRADRVAVEPDARAVVDRLEAHHPHQAAWRSRGSRKSLRYQPTAPAYEAGLSSVAFQAFGHRRRRPAGRRRRALPALQVAVAGRVGAEQPRAVDEEAARRARPGRACAARASRRSPRVRRGAAPARRAASPAGPARGRLRRAERAARQAATRERGERRERRASDRDQRGHGLSPSIGAADRGQHDVGAEQRAARGARPSRTARSPASSAPRVQATRVGPASVAERVRRRRVVAHDPHLARGAAASRRCARRRRGRRRRLAQPSSSASIAATSPRAWARSRSVTALRSRLSCVSQRATANDTTRNATTARRDCERTAERHCTQGRCRARRTAPVAMRSARRRTAPAAATV